MEAMEIVVILIYITISASGIFLNVFISVVSYRTWLSHEFHHPQGLLLFSIGLSSAIFGGYQVSMNLLYYFWTTDSSSFNVCAVFLQCLLLVSIFFSICLISWLCGFYYIRLVSSQNWVIGVLKSRLPSIVPWVISGTLLVSGMVLVSLLSVLLISVPVDNIDNSSVFCRGINKTYYEHVQPILYGFDIMLSLPFCLILVSLSCTVSTLVRHIRRVQGTLSLDRSHLEPHIQAAKTMVLLLVLNISFYASTLMTHWKSLPFAISFICVIIFYSFWPLQALTLIFRTKKLHSHFMSCLQRRCDDNDI